MATKVDKSSKKCVTPRGRASFPHLFEPHSGFENQEPKYSMTLLFDKKADLTELKRIVFNAATEKFGPKEKWPKNFRLPFRNGDEKSDLQGYEGCTYVNATSKQRPQVVDKDLSPLTGDDHPGLYAGCYVRAELMAFAYDKMGNRGVALGLQNVQKLAEGEAFSGRRQASEVFDSVDDGSDDKESYGSDNSSDDIDLGD